MSETYSRAVSAWNGLDAYRAERARCKRYVYGDQWSDPITAGHGVMTEGQLLRDQGQAPLKNNILRRILRNVVGLYRSRYKVPLLTSGTGTLKGKALRETNRKRREWFRENRMEELAPRLLEEFLISGMVAVKVEGPYILPVTPDNFFFTSDGYDPRSRDLQLIGEIHLVGFGTLLEKFCQTVDDYRRLTAAYGPEVRSADCRLAEVWHKETSIYALDHDEESGSLSIRPMEKPELDGQAQTITRSVWKRTWYASDGTKLRESEVYDSHPYVFKAYPFLDGEVHSYISDIIDQQRFVNRLITLYDLIMRSSAKGVLLFPDESIPTGMSLQDIADEWSQFNGVIPYRARPGVPMPAQVSANSTNIGIAELLKIEMQMLEDISGVSPTLQGQLSANATSGSLFAQQNEAAQTSLLDIIRSFTDFLSRLADNIPPDFSVKE